MYGLGSIPDFPYYNLALVMMGIVTAFTFAVLWIPETPRWLLLKCGDSRQATAALRFLRGPKYPHIDEEIQAIKSSISNRRPNFCHVMKRMFLDRSVLVPFLLVLFLYVFQHLCGVVSIVGYAGLIFRKAGVTDPDVTSTYAIGGASLVGVILANFLVEVVGRKPLLAISSTGMVLGSILLGTPFYISRSSLCDDSMSINITSLPHEEEMTCNPPFLPLVIIGVVIFTTSFSLGLGPIPWVLVSEYLPRVWQEGAW